MKNTVFVWVAWRVPNQLSQEANNCAIEDMVIIEAVKHS